MWNKTLSGSLEFMHLFWGNKSKIDPRVFFFNYKKPTAQLVSPVLTNMRKGNTLLI